MLINDVFASPIARLARIERMDRAIRRSTERESDCMAHVPGDNDPLLAGLFSSRRQPRGSDSAIRQVMTDHAVPLVDKLLSHAVAQQVVSATDSQDLAGEIAVRLVGKLRRLVESTESEPIARFDDYVGAVVHNALEDHRRRLDPLRARLENRIRYVMTHTDSLALWGREPLLCGHVEWKGRMDTSSVPADQRIPADALHDVKKLRGVLARIFDDSGGPVELPVLVETLVVAAGFAPQPFVSASTLRQQAVVDSTPTSLESREYLAQLWTEIEQLPVRQRRALLLQLSLDDGESVAPVLTAIGIASVRQLAGALEWPVADLLALWNELPLPDQRIAAMLSITRQQVINLRKSARERLARRMRRPRGAARNGA